MLMRIAIGALLLLYSTALMGQSITSKDVGEVAFANSGSVASQAEFLRGLALLHNFEYPEAAMHFRRPEEIDPRLAMPYLGEPMTNNHGFLNFARSRNVLLVPDTMVICHGFAPVGHRKARV